MHGCIAREEGFLFRTALFAYYLEGRAVSALIFRHDRLYDHHPLNTQTSTLLCKYSLPRRILSPDSHPFFRSM
jgi:hypothetical protein